MDALLAWGDTGSGVAANVTSAVGEGGEGPGTEDGSPGGGRGGGDAGDAREWEYPGVTVARDGHLGALMELATATELGVRRTTAFQPGHGPGLTCEWPRCRTR